MIEVLKKEVLKEIEKDKIGSLEGLFTEEGWEVHDLQPFKATPRRIEDLVEFRKEAGFIKYTKDFLRKNSAIFIDDKKITTCFDYHSKNENESIAAWNKHKAVLIFKENADLQKWLNLDNKLIDSKELVEFLELNFGVMQENEGSNVQKQLEIFRDLRAKTEVENNSKTGNYDNSIEYKNRAFIVSGYNGKTELPSGFLIGGNLYDGVESAASFQIKIFARIDKNSGSILLRLSFANKEKAISDCLENIQKRYLNEFSECEKVYLA